MKVSFIAFTGKGLELADRLSQGLQQQGHTTTCTAGFGANKVNHKEWTRQQFETADALVFVGATGIAVRSIAPYLQSKKEDPAVVVIDEQGKNCISLLSGHIGGANELTQTLSDYCGARAIVTTASDLNRVFAVDNWAVDQELYIDETAGIKMITRALLTGQPAECSSDIALEGTAPTGVVVVDSAAPRTEGIPRFHVGHTLTDADLDLISRTLILGIGCRKDTPQEAIETGVRTFIEQQGINPHAICCVASIDLKANEPGLVAFAANHNLPLVTFDAETLNAQEGDFSASEFVAGVTGTECVCERAAVAAGGRLIAKKTVTNGITCAFALRERSVAWPEPEQFQHVPTQEAPAKECSSELIVVGLGPGDPAFMSQECVEALQTAEMICGYHVYVDLAKQVAPETPVFTTPMTKEIDRCRAALEMAASGKRVAMVCSGDAGVFGMAGLCMELAHEFNPVDIRVIPGITAALSGASRLGAPLTHDFCVISLSDLLTPWELIEQRLKAAAQADFCVALYNPASKKRSDYLQKACDLLMTGKEPETICGVVRNIGRPGEETWVGTLEQLRTYPADMFCTVFIGNSNTVIIDGKMVTPRGYQKKRQWNKEA